MSTVPFQKRTPPLPVDLAKSLPNNLEAERSVLGAILLDNSAFVKALRLLHIDDFFLSQHRQVWDAFCELGKQQITDGEKNFHFDLVLLTEYLHNIGKLENAGGAPYLASLADGMPRVSNIEHYCKIVHDKALLRNLIHTTHNIQSHAFDDQHDVNAVLRQAQDSIAMVGQWHHAKENPCVVVSFRDLLTMELPPLNFLFEPLLTEGGTGEMWGWRGTGKSFLATEMAMGIALGKPTLFPNSEAGGGNWPVKRAYRVLYVYGEMHGSMIKQRANDIANGHGMALPPQEGFGIVSKDFQKNWRPRLEELRNRKFIEERIFGGGYDLVIFDNLSTLWPAAQEGEGERTAVLCDWFADLNQRGVSVIYLHHAGKGGDQRGGSEKEDMLDFVISLKNPPGYKREQQLRCDVEITKIRGECRKPAWLVPFEVSLTTDRGAALWLIRPSEHAKFRACFEHFSNGMKPGTDMAAETQASRASTYRWHKKYLANSDPQWWIDRGDM